MPDKASRWLPKAAVDNSLSAKIIRAYAQSTFDKTQNYLPAGKLHELITKDVICEELRRRIEIGVGDAEFLEEYTSPFLEELADWVLRKALQVFATAVLCDLQPRGLLLFIETCRDEDYGNSELPLKNASPSPTSPSPFQSSIWYDLKLEIFYFQQWKFLAPVFSRSKYNYDEHYYCIFPFIKENVGPKVGAFGSVFKVKVHKDHQQHEGLETVAIKEIQVTRGNDKHGTDEAWENEARALSNINEIEHENITECIAAIRRGDSRYFMFPWADGDSLRDYWEKIPKPNLDGHLIRQTVKQLRGLADALDALHNCSKVTANKKGTADSTYEEESCLTQLQVIDEEDNVTHDIYGKNNKSIRHGDLKPENILRFLNGADGMGTLKIADMGLAKQHIVKTQDRTHLTSTRYGTILYEAPEAVTVLEGGRSRLYDIWSMGCITLEFIIWLLYGNDQLNNFYNQVKGDAQQTCQYFEVSENDESYRPEVHRIVREWISHIQMNDPECTQDSAIADLLLIVVEKLLVVPLPPDSDSSLTSGRRSFAMPGKGEDRTRYRATAAEFREALDKIISKMETPGYLFTGYSRSNIALPAPKSNMLHPVAAVRDGAPIGSQLRTPQPDHSMTGVLGRAIKTGDYALPPMKDWEFIVDNTFAALLVQNEGHRSLLSSSTKRSVLCSICSGLNFWKGGFRHETKYSILERQREDCEFCRLLHEVTYTEDGHKVDDVVFERKQSNLIVTGAPFPVLSIYKSSSSNPPTEIQTGHPGLTQSSNELLFDLIRLWLADCNKVDPLDAKHRSCHLQEQLPLPTRLIEVGTKERPILRLVETENEKTNSIGNYIALSHPWGDTTAYSLFCTMPDDVKNFKKSIPWDHLPASFKHAVICTRELGVGYLWIDSICIIQGPDGDFNSEAKNMEYVFSGAYCVLAASRAIDQRTGFLGPRAQRQYVTFQRGDEDPFHICKTVDNFNKDVIEGSLNKRGWVLQERALARRTIYFTETQTYFECGDGIRCETLTKMHNNMADFLGDPEFPRKAMQGNRARKIAYFQDLYKLYSRLNFSYNKDRPFAIAGLEKRLQNGFGTQGEYGIFDDGNLVNGGLFHRSLLWKRGESEDDVAALTPIQFPPERNINVPTWSWMAYVGGIDYDDPVFQTADWETEEITAPWTEDAKKGKSPSLDGRIGIKAIIRDFDVKGRSKDDVKTTYDDPERRTTGPNGERAQCVVVAKAKARTEEIPRADKRHYVLLVVPTGDVDPAGTKEYNRVGMGFMLGKYITWDQGVSGKIY